MDSKKLDTSFSALLLAQSRIFEVIASNTTLAGAHHDLARQFGVAPDDFLDCLDGLVRAGWVRAEVDPEGTVTIRLD